MNVINVHERTVNQPKARVSKLLETMATANDKIWPRENWPAIKFKDGLKIGSYGGHGPIKYKIIEYDLGNAIHFEFLKPSKFKGYHKFEIFDLEHSKTKVVHSLQMKTFGLGTLYWVFAIRWLHDALIEDAFNKIENEFSINMKMTKWGFWVKFLRLALK